MFVLSSPLLVIVNFTNSRHGSACISIRENEIASDAMGINTTYYKVLAFAIGSFFAGIAGALYAHNFYIIQPANFGFLKSIDILIYVVLGGLGVYQVRIVATILLTVVSTFLQGYPETRMIIYSLVLIIVMLYRPKGLMGTMEITDYFKLWRRFKRRRTIMPSKPLLKVENVGIQFGGLKPFEFQFKINQGELVGLIGPNGAGKTTSFNLLTGVYTPTEGDIFLNGERINGMAPYQVTRKGISRTFQNIRLFNELSVLDNVKVAYHTLAKHSVLSSVLRLPSHFTGEKEMEEKAIGVSKDI